MVKAKKITGVVFLVTLAAALIYMTVGVIQILRAGPATSFPWYSACWFTALFFGPALVLELVVYWVLFFKTRM